MIKNLIKSKTFWGILTTLIGVILHHNPQWGIEIPAEVLYGTGAFTAYGMRDAIGKDQPLTPVKKDAPAEPEKTL